MFEKIKDSLWYQYIKISCTAAWPILVGVLAVVFTCAATAVTLSWLWGCVG